ncbi:GlsB/YeaQ/YmgE family stress response membrane protein [Bacillus dakarensis]|uniref:GlsB/YeaQ/YmgE family stress response membrane protein n=1 Tax=Robertmurraya dakarensis TaxID=1926278 RepID=UPI00098201AD|nr:GlsB/YeaQ/YmgE family stress response membrane protein [Bacillus dakarensis]
MSLITFILTALISLIIGTVAEKLSPVGMPGGWAGAIVAGFIGAWLGPLLFGVWGPMLVGFSLVPSLLGSIIVVILAGVIAKIFD